MCSLFSFRDLTSFLNSTTKFRELRNRMTSSSTSTVCRRLVGKVAIVTASTEGIGFAIARRLGEEGCHVVISSRRQANVDRALKELQADGLNVSGTVCHVDKEEDRLKMINEAAAKHGGIDILVSNAAANPAVGPMFNTTSDKWDKIFNTNVKASFMLLKECLPHMKGRKGASVVFVSSVSGYHPFAMLGAYSVSKTALLGLTKALASECGPMGIRVNCIAPGLIITKFSKVMWNNEEIAKAANSSGAIKRSGKPEECAGAVAFLCSDDAAYITGETIVITGGGSSRL